MSFTNQKTTTIVNMFLSFSRNFYIPVLLDLGYE